MDGKLILFGLLALLVGGFFLMSARKGGARTPASDSSDARALVRDGAMLLDVRTPEEFASGHVDGAINIPVDDLQSRMRELPATDRPIVVYCRSGGRSARAASMLGAAGYVSVHDLGPMSAW